MNGETLELGTPVQMPILYQESSKFELTALGRLWTVAQQATEV